ncbi:MAG: NAD(P)H-dependent oxidoreductase [Bermanella sp.]
MKFLIFLGSVRESTPPRPARLGLRVSRAISTFFEQAFTEHSIEIIDPLDFELGPVFKPHFSYAPSRLPQDLESLAQKIQEADGYVMVSPEYNHSMSPALANLLNHFGSSLFSYKPSTILTYSAGQWGGSRAAVGMRSFLSELGCLPVSAMIHIPHAQQVFDEKGLMLSGVDENKWHEYFARALDQMLWWAQAAKEQSGRVDPHDLVKAFKRDPSQRNAP